MILKKSIGIALLAISISSIGYFMFFRNKHSSEYPSISLMLVFGVCLWGIIIGVRVIGRNK